MLCTLVSGLFGSRPQFLLAPKVIRFRRGRKKTFHITQAYKLRMRPRWFQIA